MDELNTKDVYVTFKDNKGNILKEGNMIVTNEFLEHSNINAQVIMSLEYFNEYWQKDKISWQKFKKDKLDGYREGYNKLQEFYDFSYISEPIEKTLFILERDLRKMDKLDGTNDFKELLEELDKNE